MKATSTSWKTEPLPASRTRLKLDRSFDAFPSAGNLVCNWNPLAGLAATIETFYNARAGATSMNATSSQYSPLVAKRLS